MEPWVSIELTAGGEKKFSQPSELGFYAVGHDGKVTENRKFPAVPVEIDVNGRLGKASGKFR